jgi:hypothetical protein
MWKAISDRNFAHLMSKRLPALPFTTQFAGARVMNTNTMIVTAIVVVAIAFVALLVFLRNRKTVKLRRRFGPEYARTVEESSGKVAAEAQLHDREKRVAEFAVQPLGPGDRERFSASWSTVQSEFVDNPKRAVAHADELLGDVMAARGFPVSDFEQRAADLSVDHSAVVQNYRAAHDIALREGRGEAGTEDLRQAMIHYRALFDELASDAAPARANAA